MAYFQLIQTYPLGTAKGGCYLCGEGGTVEGPKVDTGIVIDFEGGLVVCHACILQIAQLCGLVERHYVDEALASVHELQAAADEAVAERDEARQLVHLLRRVDEREPTPRVAPTFHADPEIYSDLAEIYSGLATNTVAVGDNKVKPARKPRAKASA